MIKRTAFAQRLVREGHKGHKGIRVSESSCVSPEFLRQGLRKVVAEGTGKALKQPTVPPVAGKSGTAEAWKGRVKQNHAWFGAYAPAEQPEVAIVAFAEHSGGGGGSIAAPMILQIMEEYFQRKYPGKYQKPAPEKP